MNNMHDPNQPYRRPRPHFSAEEDVIRPTIDRRRLLTGSALLLGLALVLILAMIPLRSASPDEESDAAQVHSSTAQTLAAECAVIRERAFAVSVGEMEAGLSAAATPILSPGGVSGALAIASTTTRLPQERYEEIRALLVEAAGEITAALGG